MAPSMDSVNKLLRLLLPTGPDRSEPALRRRLQSTMLYPPESEPSRRQVENRWLAIMERRRLEHQLVLAEELTRLSRELDSVLMSDKENKLAKNVDQALAFLMALQTSPSSDTVDLATKWQEDRKHKIFPETESELNKRLYRSIIEDEPFEGDHWQTDIYAGSSSSYSGSVASSDPISSREASVIPNQHPVQPVHSAEGHASPLAQSPQADLDQKSALHRNTCAEDWEAVERTIYWSKPERMNPGRNINELIAVREVLSALQGLGGDLIFCKSVTEPRVIQLVDDLPTLLKNSEMKSISIFKSYIPLLSSLETLRGLSEISKISTQSAHNTTRTQEAFAASLQGLLQRFNIFLASIELKLLNLPITQIHSTCRASQSGTVVSLLRLHNDLVSLGWAELLCVLASTHSPSASFDVKHSDHAAVKTCRLLNSLHQIASFFDTHSNFPIAVDESRRVFLETLQPVWTWIGNWMLHGRLPGWPSIFSSDCLQTSETVQEGSLAISGRSSSDHEDSKEFFIRQTELGTSWTSGDWWDGGHVLKTELSPTASRAQDTVPQFLAGCALEIVEGGKARALSNILGCGHREDIVQDTWPNLKTLLDISSSADATPERVEYDQGPGHVLCSFLFNRSLQNVHLQSPHAPFPHSGILTRTLSRPHADFKSQLVSKLESRILRCNQQNHEYLHKKFISPSKLSSYLIGLNAFFLHGSLSTSVFVKKVLDNVVENSGSPFKPHFGSKRWWDPEVLNYNLSKSLELSPTSPIRACLPKVTVGPEYRRETDPIKCLSGIQINLSIPAPFNYVLDEKIVLESYNRIFGLLAQLSQSSKTLNNLILVKPNIPFASLNGKTFEQQSESRSFYKLKNRLSWFVNLLMDYYMNLVIGKWRETILGALERVVDLNQKVEQVRRWMKRLISLMFLSPESRPLHRIIVQLFKLCYNCSEVWTAFNRQSNSLTFMHSVEDQSIDTERRRRREVRWKKRIEKEQYTLIDQAAGLELVNSVEVNGEGLIGEMSVAETIDQDTESFIHIPSFVLETLDDGSFAEKFTRMNVEFEKLLGALQRGVGSLGRRPNRNYNPRASLARLAYEGDDVGGKDEVEQDDVPLHHLNGDNFIHEQEDLDSLMLFECSLDEWLL